MFDKKQLLKLVDHDKELLLSIIEIFKTEWPDAIDGIDSHLQKSEAEEAEKLAHKLKGNLKNFYAEECIDIAQDLETACRNNDSQAAMRKLEKLKPLCKKLENELTISADEI
ncbi:MAG: Hpt domain-containing protein [Bdellovibrionales bacterium]|nr:Hpt domain-containing protein [Bdellovibrionales bacterium]